MQDDRFKPFEHRKRDSFTQHDIPVPETVSAAAAAGLAAEVTSSHYFLFILSMKSDATASICAMPSGTRSWCSRQFPVCIQKRRLGPALQP